MLFHIFTRGTSAGLGSITSNGGLIKSLNIKRDFFPIVTTVTIAILALVDVGVFFALMPVFQFTPSWTIVLLPIPMMLLFVLILGLSYFLSIASVFVKDIRVVWPIFTHTLLFISPIFWKLDEVSGVLVEIQKINPLGQLIEISHKLVINNQIPTLQDWLYTGFFIFGIFIAGYFVFHTLQERIVEEL